MRTNTWLGLMMLQNEVNHWDLDARMAERDRIRDEKFDRAAKIAQNAQFAMWIQTPDGKTFDRWERHALAASRAIDDRQAAWDNAWYLEAQAANPPVIELTPGGSIRKPIVENTPVVNGVERPWDVLPWHRILRPAEVPVVAEIIDDFVDEARDTLPRLANLPPLSGVYYTYPPDEAEATSYLPDRLLALLKGFAAEDETRVAALRSEGFQ